MPRADPLVGARGASGAPIAPLAAAHRTPTSSSPRESGVVLADTTSRSLERAAPALAMGDRRADSTTVRGRPRTAGVLGVELPSGRPSRSGGSSLSSQVLDHSRDVEPLLLGRDGRDAGRFGPRDQPGGRPGPRVACHDRAGRPRPPRRYGVRLRLARGDRRRHHRCRAARPAGAAAGHAPVWEIYVGVGARPGPRSSLVPTTAIV